MIKWKWVLLTVSSFSEEAYTIFYRTVESNATWLLLKIDWKYAKTYSSYYQSEWLGKILKYDEACKSEYEKILVQNWFCVF